MCTAKPVNVTESGFFFGDIPERVTNALKITAERENVFEFSILLSTIAIMSYRCTGYEKTNLKIKTADLSAKIELDLAPASTARELFRHSQSKLEETLRRSFGRGMEIELPGDVTRPVIRRLNESTDFKATLPRKNENCEDGIVCCGDGSEKYFVNEPERQINGRFTQILSGIIENPDVMIKDI